MTLRPPSLAALFGAVLGCLAGAAAGIAADRLLEDDVSYELKLANASPGPALAAFNVLDGLQSVVLVAAGAFVVVGLFLSAYILLALSLAQRGKVDLLRDLPRLPSEEVVRGIREMAARLAGLHATVTDESASLDRKRVELAALAEITGPQQEAVRATLRGELTEAGRIPLRWAIGGVAVGVIAIVEAIILALIA